MKNLLAALLCLASCAPEPGAPDEPVPSQASEPLLLSTGVQLFTQNGNVVPLCWYTPGFGREKALFRDAVTRTWGRLTPLQFTWREGCPTSGSERHVKIQIGAHTQVQDSAGNWFWDHSTDGQTRGLGMATLTTPQEIPAGVFSGRGVTIWVETAGTSEQHRLEYVAVHEMGHVLGFEHEQDRAEAEARACGPAGSGTPVGLYDRDSVMNYCNSRGNRSGLLSEGDAANVQGVYGFRAARPDALADLDGDHRADPIAVNLDGTYALRSSGVDFAQFARWSDPFYGTRETLFADVTGDGRADAIAVNNGGVYVMTSDGARFTNWGAWVTSPFYGARRTLAGDVNGDGLADLVAINNQGIYVMTSTGSSFSNWAQWSGAFFGTLATSLGDVDGDGRADVIANRGTDGVFVRLSSGAGFLPESRWYGSFFGERQTAFADVNGDGRLDGLAVNDEGIEVILSTGVDFVPAGRWSPFAFFGSRDTLFADVDGDGRADAVAVNNTGLWVMTSNGAGFDFLGQWSGAFYSL